MAGPRAPHAPVYAGEDEIIDMTQLTKPDTAVISGGVGLISSNPRSRSLFGQYNGLRQDDAYLLLDGEYIKRNDATGDWTVLYGRDLGLQTRELGFIKERLAPFKYPRWIEFIDELPKTASGKIQRYKLRGLCSATR